MKGVQFLTDEHGNPKSIVLDIEEWGDLWAIFRDGMLAEPARGTAAAAQPSTAKAADGDAATAAGSDGVNGAAADPSTGPSFADRMEALCEQPPSQVRAVAMLRLLSQATPADKAELLERALAQMTDEDRREMREFAEEGLEEDLKHWPEYDAVNGAAADPSTGPSFADRMEALCEQPPSPARAVEMLRILSHATPADKAELLQRALARIDPEYEQRFAEGWSDEDLQKWLESDDAQRSQADIEREYAQAARRAVDRSFPPSRRATDWDDGALKRELAKITDEDRREMQAIADEGLEEDLKHWPED